ncbi:MAG: Uma2 family endonuclease [Lewinellaceae bacterium]|nr:Uma2 family endonuclease [Lewinellaceae bacterium]MCB9285921.1 Uma2 family endonuclease [Lewinellaceae bacterium]
MAVKLAQRLITTEEYFKMAEAGILKQDDRVELIDGKIIEMSPIGSKHAACVDKIIATLNRLNNPDVLIRGQNPIRLNKYSAPEPDVAIVRFSPDYYSSGHPSADDILLVIEVSDSSLEYDREIKLPLYASANIPECWIVNLEKREIEVYHSPVGDRYKSNELFLFEDEMPARPVGVTFKVSELLV